MEGDYNDILYDSVACLAKCIEIGDTLCETFEITDTASHCIIYTTCGTTGPEIHTGGQTWGKASSTHTIISGVLPTQAPTPPPTGAPTLAPQCTTSVDCSGTEICDNQYQCTTIACSTHNECFGNFLVGRLPLCDHKIDSCVDIYASSCLTQRRCRSQARRKWRQQRAFGKAKLLNQEIREDKREEATLRALELLDVSLEGKNNSLLYIGVVGYDTITIDNTTLTEAIIVNGYTEEHVFNAMIELRCGDSSDECTYEVPTRRMLADENVTITISYDVDEQVYLDLTTSGYQFGTNNFTDALAETLNLDPEQVTIVLNDGQIEIEITIIDDITDGDPIDDSFLDDIDLVQAELDTVFNDVETELGINNMTLAGVDYCGDRTCDGHGTCNSQDGVCSCDTDYGGVNCQIYIACANDDDCLNGGTCTSSSARCSCEYPWYGVFCEEILTTCVEQCN